MIEVENVIKEFVSKKNVFRALNGASLTIADGEFVAITGKSGSGKSTLLNIIGTLERATSGRVCVDGENLAELSGRQISEYRNKKVGFIFQSFYLEPGYTVFENVELPLVLAGNKKNNRSFVEAALSEVGLLSKIKEKAVNLSGGEQQRVAIARAIINDPSFILADEPCGNLDTHNSENIMRILESLHRLGKTVVMVTHDPEDARKAERIITLSDGKTVSAS